MLFMVDSILIKPLSSKSIVWFKASNTYVLVAYKTAEILLKISEGISLKSLKKWGKTKLELTSKQGNTLLESTYRLFADLNKSIPDVSVAKNDFRPPKSYASIKLYKIGVQYFKLSFETEALAFLIHPKFAHLEVRTNRIFDHHFEVFKAEDNIVLQGEKGNIGVWEPKESHYFQGKFSMSLLEKMYDKAEADWLAVFHASAISDGENCILFMGDSGNGKSTLAALLIAHGYTLFADDFVPVSAALQQVYYFPAAISIKESAVTALSPFYPKLNEEMLYDFKRLNKKVRYLAAPPLLKDQKKQLPCKALVFVKYIKNGEFKFKKMEKELAFQQLIPDSWLSPERNNAALFLDWFAEVPCYQLSYSDNELMYQCVSKLFKDDL